NTSRAGNAQRRDAGAGLHQQRVGVSVVAPFKLDDVLAPGKSPSQTDGGHRSFSAGADESYLLDRGKCRDDLLCQLGFTRCARAEACAVAIGLGYSFDYSGMRVPQNQRPPGADIIDVLVVIDIPNPGAQAAHDVGRLTADGAERPHRRIHAAGNDLAGTLVQFLTLGLAFGRGRHAVNYNSRSWSAAFF